MCAQNGVHEIKFGDLHLIFGEANKPPTQYPRAAKTKLSEQESKKISNEAQMIDRAQYAQEYIDELRLSDPLEYEKLLAGDGDVGDTA